MVTHLDSCRVTLLKYKPDDVHLTQQQYRVCHHCQDGHDQRVELEILTNNVHKRV